jgi:aminoglycoside phosphotransferase (APT) family kinase protein
LSRGPFQKLLIQSFHGRQAQRSLDNIISGKVDQPGPTTAVRLHFDKVDTARVLLQHAEATQAGTKDVGQDRPVDTAMGDEQDLVPTRVRQELCPPGQNAVQETAERLAIEEFRFRGETESEAAEKGMLKGFMPLIAQFAGTDFLQAVKALKMRRLAAEEDRCCFHGALQAAGDDPIPTNIGQGLSGDFRLPPAFGIERHQVRAEGLASGVEVADLAVPDQIHPSPRRRRPFFGCVHRYSLDDRGKRFSVRIRPTMPQTILERREALESFLSGQAQALARIVRACQLTGGASRETWAVDVETDAPPAELELLRAPSRKLITLSSAEVVDLADPEQSMVSAPPSAKRDSGTHALQPSEEPVSKPAEEGPQGKTLLKLILRMDMGGEIYEGALSRAQEFELMRLVHRAGVLVPRPRWVCEDVSVLGAPFFLMDRLEGESVGRRIVKEPALANARQALPRQMGEQLARIHAIDPFQDELVFLPRPMPEQSSSQMALDISARHLWEIGEPHPVLEWAYRWLDRNQPKSIRLALLHGDFRLGNLLIGPEGLRGIIDWEFAHLGDPAEELAWPCVRSWRHGQERLHLGGVGHPEEFLTAYEAVRETKVDRNALRYWEIMGNFRWAVGCIVQANRHLSGQIQSLELASLGRRTCEVELELLELIAKELG